jgi:hypothetical protein
MNMQTRYSYAHKIVMGGNTATAPLHSSDGGSAFMGLLLTVYPDDALKECDNVLIEFEAIEDIDWMIKELQRLRCEAEKASSSLIAANYALAEEIFSLLESATGEDFKPAPSRGAVASMSPEYLAAYAEQEKAKAHNLRNSASEDSCLNYEQMMKIPNFLDMVIVIHSETNTPVIHCRSTGETYMLTVDAFERATGHKLPGTPDYVGFEKFADELMAEQAQAAKQREQDQSFATQRKATLSPFAGRA